MSTQFKLLAIWLASVACIAPSFAYWQSRDSGYNVSVGSAPSEATVLIDQTNVARSSASVTGTTLANILNVGAGPNGTSNIILIASILLCQATAGTSVPTAVVWDSAGTTQAMTRLTWAGGANDHIGNGTAGDIYSYYRIAPTLGNKSLNVTWTNSNQIVVGIASFVNVDQTGGNTTFPNVQPAIGSSGIPTIPISTSPTTRKIIGAFASGTTNFSTTGNTAYTGSPDNACNTAATANAWDAGTVTSLSYNPSSAGAWAALGVVLKGN